jgi:hypothetical protein
MITKLIKNLIIPVKILINHNNYTMGPIIFNKIMNNLMDLEKRAHFKMINPLI